jgi:hypothetical protein
MTPHDHDTEPVEGLDDVDATDTLRLKARVRNLNDTVQEHRIKVAEHGVLIENLSERVNVLQSTTVTREGLANAVSSIHASIQQVKNDLAPIQRGIYWVVTLVFGALILAVLSLIFRGQQHDRSSSDLSPSRGVLDSAARDGDARGRGDAAGDRAAGVALPAATARR